ncbi:MAG: DUF218 domain-containing protein [Fibrobacter sp.]|nr:DUF218 domain-containing protein [Fibrobacter sp.]
MNFKTITLFFSLKVLLLSFILFFLYKPLKNYLSKHLKNYLCIPSTIPDSTEIDALYVLGGSLKSTSRHLSTASLLQSKYDLNRILIYNNNDSSVFYKKKMIIKRVGIPDSVVSFFNVKDGFFGTMTEARVLSNYFMHQNYNSIILVSSHCHSRRVMMSFKHFLNNNSVSISFVGSNDQFYLRELVLEFIKVQIYKLIFIFNDIKKST